MNVEEKTDGAGAKRRRPAWRFHASIAFMVVLFAVAVIQRNPIRAHWWAFRLNQAGDLTDEQLTFYASSLAAVGEEAKGAIERLTRSDRPEIRSLTVAVLAQLPADLSVSILGRLVHDSDRDVRESSALTLAFLNDPRAESALVDALRNDDPGAAAAAASGLGRVATGSAQAALASAIERHEHPVVRAQAVESLAESLFAFGDLAATQTAVGSPVEPDTPLLALVIALDNTERFEGTLTTERRIEAVAGFVATSTTLPVDFGGEVSSGRRIADVAAKALRDLTGEDVAPAIDRSPVEQAGLADTLRGRMLARRRESRPGK